MIIAKRLKDLRAESGKSQRELAKLVGCSQANIARWENGDCEPLASWVVKLADALNCSCDYLLGKSDTY